MKIATWNVNSIRSRFDHIVQWLSTHQPDVLLLQETKITDKIFPLDLFMDEGYQCAFHGQKSYNGVAILSKYKIEEISIGFPNNPLPDQARYIEGLIDGRIRVASLYVPNGQNKLSSKFPSKIEFLHTLHDYLAPYALDDVPYVIGGDYNIAPQDEDATYPEKWIGDVPFTPTERSAYRKILSLGFQDAIRIKHPYEADNSPSLMTWWNYRAGAFEKDHGLRIDHLLLSAKAVDLFQDAGTDRILRSLEKPSDHIPVWCELK